MSMRQDLEESFCDSTRTSYTALEEVLDKPAEALGYPVPNLFYHVETVAEVLNEPLIRALQYYKR
jgi:hypothetical protein